MATYKVIQDIEAEDKFVGPLTLKQFIFAMAGSFFGYLSFFALSRGFLWALALTLPPALFGFFMAIPWSKDQPTDVWVLAKLRFRLKPKQRVWDQDGVQDLVTITAPKKEEKPLTKNMSQAEVKSRLELLAQTIDSRGWAIKHAEFQSQAAAALTTPQPTEDRLISTDTLPQEVPDADPTIPDMLEGQPKIDSMLQQSDENRKRQLYEKMDQIRKAGDAAESPSQPLVAPPVESPDTEQAIAQSLKAKRQASSLGTSNLHSIGSVSTEEPPENPVAATEPPLPESVEVTEVEKPQASMTQQGGPDILGWAGNNDLNVSTIARQVNDDKEKDSEEVVISLH